MAPDTSRGAAYVFERNKNGADAWGQVAKLTASDAVDLDAFGGSVAVSVDTVIIGAAGRDESGYFNCGAAYIFNRNKNGADAWGQVAKLTATDGQDNDTFGYSVTISRDTVAVGANYEDGAGTNRGAVYVFERNKTGADAWGVVTKVVAEDGEDDDFFGAAISISNDTLAVGAPYKGDDYNNRGAVYIFERNREGADAWGQVAKRSCSYTLDDNLFGYSVSLDGDLLAVGDHRKGITGTHSGAVYIFARHLSGDDAWGLMGQVIGKDTVEQDFLGYSVSLSGTTLAAGAPYKPSGYYYGASYIINLDAWAGFLPMIAN